MTTTTQTTTQTSDRDVALALVSLVDACGSKMRWDEHSESLWVELCPGLEVAPPIAYRLLAERPDVVRALLDDERGDEAIACFGCGALAVRMHLGPCDPERAAQHRVWVAATLEALAFEVDDQTLADVAENFVLESDDEERGDER